MLYVWRGHNFWDCICFVFLKPLLWGKTHTVLHGVEFRSVISFTKAPVCMMETIKLTAALNL